ncbi:hypothetical protein [uncultured Limosilactobacillus sp.]|uniref:hypothetical protein n=1 Tax=uncultured Limosilactobacillus sp. TaxID=2837629 RepID=UPI0025D98213|nr:hypothetical protein [uncultured Limosilactobacillus sp.]
MTNYPKRELKDLNNVLNKVANIEGCIAKLETEIKAQQDHATQRQINKNINGIRRGVRTIIKDEERIAEGTCLANHDNLKTKIYLNQTQAKLTHLENALTKLCQDFAKLPATKVSNSKHHSPKLTMAKLVINKANASRKYAPAS